MLKLNPDKLFSGSRLLRFSAAGLIATATHLAALLALSQSAMPIELANALAFCSAFAVSMHLQQAISFSDRLQGRRLNALGLTGMLSANLAIGALVAHITGKTWSSLALPLLPASVNYFLLLLFSSRRCLALVTSAKTMPPPSLR